MSFQDIKGHDNIVRLFKKELGSGKTASSYLFFGPESAGKTQFAKTLAKALNCLNLKDDSCDKCLFCNKIDNNHHPDVSWVETEEGKDAISIEQIRELQRQINLKPYEGRTKVFIIKESHRMTMDGANCLLKTLEEPPENSVIILITSRVDEVLATVRSRCKKVKFDALELKLRIELLKKQGFNNDETLFLSRLANSGISISADSEGKKEFGIFEYRNRIVDEFNSQKTLLDEGSFIFGESKERMKFAISILESWFRDIMILKAGGPQSILINADRKEELKALKEKFSLAELEDILKGIEDARFYIDRNVGPKVALNNLKMRIAK